MKFDSVTIKDIARALNLSTSTVSRALRGSYEELFYEFGLPRFWINLRARNGKIDILREPRLERAIG